MTDKEGTLQMQPSGRWAVCRPGRSPVAIAAGDLFRPHRGAGPHDCCAPGFIAR
jgi:hypothetical protein